MTTDVFRDALILTGPTGSGKSRLSLELAEQLDAEIVAMDSMTLYRGMDIGTAKPSPADRRRIPHHLLDVLEPWESASVAWWLEQAAACCRDIQARGKRALFVGGTPLYLKALLYGLFDGPPADEAIRLRLTAEAELAGAPALHQRLAAVDAVSAGRVHANDLRRIIRALEVWEITGRPISAWQTQWRAPPPADDGPPRCLCLDLARPVLHARINARALQMMADGLVEECRALRRLGRPLGREVTQAVGYRETFEYLDGKADLEETTRRIQAHTRQLAKRQLTWFRHLSPCRLISGELTFALWGLRIQRSGDEPSRE
jgi:tRNA dimethylallyltransferase